MGQRRAHRRGLLALLAATAMLLTWVIAADPALGGHIDGGTGHGGGGGPKPQPTPEPEPGADQDPTPVPYFGVTGQFIPKTGLFSVANPEAHLDAIAGFSLRMVRLGIPWHGIEPEAPVHGVHSYDWSTWDRAVRLTASRGIEIYAAILYGTRWASGDWTTLEGWKKPPRPAYHADFAAYAAALASRYGRDGSFWAENPDLPYRPMRSFQVWNEGNWRGPARFEPEPFADLFVLTEAAVKKVDPEARVIFGSLWSAKGVDGAIDGDQYLRRAFARQPQLRDVVEAVGVQLYGHWAEVALDLVARWRRWIDSEADPAIDIDIQEDGASVLLAYDWWRGDYLSKMAETAPFSGCGVSTYIAHAWRTPERILDDPEHWYGMANVDGTPKESAKRYAAAAATAQQSLDGGTKPNVTPVCP